MKLYEPEDGGGRTGAALRWGAAGLLVAGVHLGAGWWLVSHSFAAPPPDQAQGIPIDLEPVAEPQDAPAPSSAAAAGPAPTPQAAAAAEPTETPEPPATEPPRDVTPPTPEPPSQVTEATPPEPAPQPPEQPQTPPPPEPPPVAPPPPQDIKSDAVLAAPPPPPRPKTPPKPDPRVLAREAAKRKALAEKRERERAERAEARAAARAQARAARVQEGGGAASTAAAPSSAASGAEMATWHGAIVAHIRRFQPSWSGAAGTASVSLAVDGNGRVISAGVSRSSGNPQIDQAALDTVRRSSPVPPPPPGSGNRFSFNIPFRFSASGRF